MIVSTRGRYALRVLIDLAENGNDGLITMKTIAERQQISLKYLEQIVPILTKGGLIEGVHGKGGGYRLKKKPASIKVKDVLTLTEGDLAPVACLEKGAKKCERKKECRTISMWTELDQLLKDFFDRYTIADLMKE